LFRTAVLHCLLLFTASFCAAEDVKKIHPSGYVSDLAGVISPEARTRLEALCAEVEQKTGAQMAVVTVQSLDGEGVENYAVNLFKQLVVGSKKDNRGVLLLVAPHERKYRIEVGYGLEPVINDARAGDAGRAMVPFLRRGDFSGATETAAWQLAKYIADDRGVTLSGQPPVRHVQRRAEGSSRGSPFWLIIVIFLFIWFISRASGGGRGGGSGWWIWPLLGRWGGRERGARG